MADYESRSLKRFDREGRLLAEIGRGPGDGPGELNAIMDFYVRGENVWIADGTTRLISHFDTSGRYIDRFRTDYSPVHVVEMLDGTLIAGGNGEDRLFRRHRPDGTSIASFGTVIENQQLSDVLTMYGHILPLDAERFAYVMSLSSHMFVFDLAGNVLHEAMGVDAIEYIRPHAPGDGAMFVAPNVTVFMENASLDGDTLYVHAYYKGEKDAAGRLIRGPESYLDRYDVQTGAYLGSIAMPFWSYSAAVAGRSVYCIRGDSTLAVLDFASP